VRSLRGRDAASFGRIASAMLAGLAGWGCGGATALNHPAHTLPEGRFSAGAGVSNQFALGQAADAIDAGRRASVSGSNAPARAQELERAALSLAAFAPGLSPWLGVRATLLQIPCSR
jgi:hypothetical protein